MCGGPVRGKGEGIVCIGLKPGPPLFDAARCGKFRHDETFKEVVGGFFWSVWVFSCVLHAYVVIEAEWVSIDYPVYNAAGEEPVDLGTQCFSALFDIECASGLVRGCPSCLQEESKRCGVDWRGARGV